MTNSIVTLPFKNEIAKSLFNDILNETTRYYIGIGRSQEWENNDTPPIPEQTLFEERAARSSLQSIKQIQNISFVVPRYNWISGTIYNEWDDIFTPDVASYYVLTEDNRVYLCLKQNKNANGEASPSLIKPSTEGNVPFTTTDGYVWKFLYTISAINDTNFVTSNYIPVQLIEDDPDNPLSFIDQQQYDIQESAIEGQISNIKILSSGTTYTTPPTITIEGNGTGATATPVLSNGVLVDIVMTNMGQGYDYANVIISGDSVARAIISPKNGFGHDPRTDLNARSLMLVARIDGHENDSFIIDNDYRQIILLKNIDNFTSANGNALNYLTFTTLDSGINPDDKIEGLQSQAVAYVDRIDRTSPSAIKVYYHQTSETGFKNFQVNEEVKNTANSNLTGQLASTNFDTAPDFNKFDGELLYIQNRNAIERAENQIDNIKIIIAI